MNYLTIEKSKTKSKSVATKSFTSTWTAALPTMYQLRYHARYDIPDAKLHEWYSLWYKHIGWRGKIKWKPYKDYTYASLAGGGKDRITGNYEWAKKLAKDLHIEMPPATHRLSAVGSQTKAKKGGH
jgi:hypothetical protein